MKFLQSPKAHRRIRRIFFVLGLILFAYLIYKIQPAVLWEYLQKIGWKFLIIVAFSCLTYIDYAFAWELFLKNLNKRVHIWNIFKIKVCGEAISHITPFSWGGGDPARIYLLKTHIPLTEGTASVVVDRTLNNLAVALFMLIGILILFIKFSLPLQLKIGLPIVLAVMVSLSVFFYIRSHEGLFEFLLDVLKKLRIKRHFSEKTLKNVQEIDSHISHFYKMNKKAFVTAFGMHYLGRLSSAIEIFLVAFFLGQNLSFLEAYLLASMTIIVNMLFIFVPGAIGVLEGAYAGIFSLLGLNPAMGTSIQIVRRARMLFWVAMGLIFLSRMKEKEEKG